MQLRCPRCRVLLEIPEPAPGADVYHVECGGCGHHFRLQLNRPSLRFRKASGDAAASTSVPEDSTILSGDNLPTAVQEPSMASPEPAGALPDASIDFSPAQDGGPAWAVGPTAVSAASMTAPEGLEVGSGIDSDSPDGPENESEDLEAEQDLGDVGVPIPDLESIVLTAAPGVNGRQISQALGQLTSVVSISGAGGKREIELLTALTRAQTALREKARALGADGVVGIQMDTLEATGAPVLRLRGTAVRLTSP